MTETPRPRVLIVDDDRTNLRLLGSLLTTRCNVSVALDGTQALKLLATQPDIALVFLDLQLPDMSGYAVAQALRADPGRFGANAAAPLVAITASDPRQVAEACQTAGVGEVLAKPVAPAALEAVMDRH